MKKKYECPWCGSHYIEPVGGIAGSVAVRCEQCGWSTGYHDAVKDALEELESYSRTNIVVDTQNAVQGKIGGQEAKRKDTLRHGNGGQENGR